ncbi:MAG: hypothetical protein Q9228_001274 [Teloschistes exilis]
MAEMSGDAITTGVRDVVLGTDPSFRVPPSFLEPLLKDGSDPVLSPPQAKSCGMRQPFRQDEVAHAADVVFHAMEQAVQFLAVLGVKVRAHETLHDDGVDELGNVLEEKHLLLSRPIGQEGPRGFTGHTRVMVQG